MGQPTSDLLDYLSGLTVSQSRLAGLALRILPWQRRFVRGAFGPGVQSAALSIGRGNGKTALLSGIAAATLDGPLAVPRGETIIVASSFEQARIAFEHVAAFMGDKLTDRARWKIWDTAQQARIEDRLTGARVRCIGSDPRRAHGLAPVLVLADEPAQWPDTTGERMVAALRTAAGKQPHSRFVALGTRPADAEHWFAKALAGGADFAQCHAAKPDDPPFRKTTWTKANPSLAHMPDLEAAIRTEAEQARRDPSLLAAFEALRLNKGTSDVLQSTLLDAGTWERIEIADALTMGPRYAMGLDLGTSAAMSAAAAFDPDGGALDAFAVFPELPDLRERGLQDGVGRLYLDMSRRGELILAGQRVSDIPTLLRAALERWGKPIVIVCDRWREAELRQALDSVGFPQAALAVRGMGFHDGGADVREFRAACLGDRVKPARSLLLRSAMGEARVLVDPAGNAKLSKNASAGRRLRARDDAAAAAILAVAEGMRRHGDGKPARRWRYLGMAG